MEFLLLWIDEMDDALGALRHMAPRIVGLLLALALFATTGFGLALAPHVTLTALAVVLSASLLEVARRRLARVVAKRDRR